MVDEIVESEEVSKMFLGQKGITNTDQELALHIMHRFNIDRETMETMPALRKATEAYSDRKKTEERQPFRTVKVCSLNRLVVDAHAGIRFLVPEGNTPSLLGIVELDVGTGKRVWIE